MESSPHSEVTKSEADDVVGRDSNDANTSGVATTSRLVLKDIHPISVNLMYRTYRGRIILSQRGREFKKVVGEVLGGMNLPKVLGDVDVVVVFEFNDRRRRDIDNYGKAIIDCVKGVMFEDDSAIMRLTMVKKLKAPASSMTVVVRAL